MNLSYSIIVWKQHNDRSNWSRNNSKFFRLKSKYITYFPITRHSQVMQKLKLNCVNDFIFTNKILNKM